MFMMNISKHCTSYIQNDNDDKKLCHVVFVSLAKLFLFSFYDEHFRVLFGSGKSLEEIRKSFLWQNGIFAFILSAWWENGENVNVFGEKKYLAPEMKEMMESRSKWKFDGRLTTVLISLRDKLLWKTADSTMIIAK